MKSIKNLKKEKLNNLAKIKGGYELKKKFEKARDKVDSSVVIS